MTGANPDEEIGHLILRLSKCFGGKIGEQNFGHEYCYVVALQLQLRGRRSVKVSTDGSSNEHRKDQNRAVFSFLIRYYSSPRTPELLGCNSFRSTTQALDPSSSALLSRCDTTKKTSRACRLV